MGMDYNVGSNVFRQKKSDVSQPKLPSKPVSTNSPTVATIVAKAVVASNVESNKIITVGKYGFALAGDVLLNYYQLLLYGSKSSILVNVILTRDFKYNVCENNTVEFLSKDKNWRLEFVSIDDAVDFNSHMAFVLWKLNGLKELSWFDLYYPSRNDKVATFGCVVEITYVVNTIQGKKIGPEVSNNINDNRYLKVNVSEDGWERSLLGVNNGTQRVVYIPNSETGAWKILTNGRQWLCLTICVKNVFEIKENNITDLPISITQEPLNKAPEINCSVMKSSDIVDNVAINDNVTSSNKICIETLFKEFEKLKIDNIETKERLTLLELLVKEKKAEKPENSSDTEFKKSMKILYKNIIREFPSDRSFDGNQIQKIIKDVFSNTLMSYNES